MTCYTGAYTGTLKAAAEIEEIVWLSYTDTDNLAVIVKDSKTDKQRTKK